MVDVLVGHFGGAGSVDFGEAGCNASSFLLCESDIKGDTGEFARDSDSKEGVLGRGSRFEEQSIVTVHEGPDDDPSD